MGLPILAPLPRLLITEPQRPQQLGVTRSVRQRTKISQKVFSSSIARMGLACTGGCSLAASTTGVSSSKRKASAENAIASTLRISGAEEPQDLQYGQAWCMHASKTQSMLIIDI